MKRCTYTIAFVSPLGGAGQTTLVANLAHLLTVRGRSCLALDLCAQNGLALHLGLTKSARQGWAELAAVEQWWGNAALENSDRVRFLPFGDPGLANLDTLNRTLQDQPDWLAQQLQGLALDAPGLVLLDAPAWPTNLALQALRCADLVVIALDATLRACQAHNQVLALLALAPTARSAVVATRFDPRRHSQRMALRTLRQQWGERLVPHVLHEDESMQAAIGAATCTTALTPQSQSAHDLQGIAVWLLSALPATAGESA
jgi:cellulose synthase operon protein YhjQ